MMSTPFSRDAITAPACTAFHDRKALVCQAGQEGADPDSLLEGISRTANSFEISLANANVEPVPAVGEAFDPELHEAVDTAEVDPEMDGRVIEEYSRGFRMGDRLLRPARVKVGRSASQARQASE